MKTEEIWKDIKGYEGLYQVSNMGRVRSSSPQNKNPDKIKSQGFNKSSGYKFVLLSKGGKITSHLTHKLVMTAFCPPPDTSLVIDHINNIRIDNRLTNLRWVTRKENNSKPHARLMRSKNWRQERHPNEMIRAEKDGQVLYFKNQRFAAEHIGCSKVLVTKALQGVVAKRAKGWKLTYIQKSEVSV